MTTRKAAKANGTSAVPPTTLTPTPEQIERIDAALGSKPTRGSEDYFKQREVKSEKPTRSIGKLFDETTLIVLNFEGVGGTRKIRTSQLESKVEFDEEVVNTSMKLFKCKEFLAIKRNEAETRAYINGRSMPSYFQRGMYLCKNSIIPSIDEKLYEFKAKRAELVEAFIDKYNDIVAEMKEKQNSLFNPKNYPSIDIVRARFAMDWHYVVFSVSGTLDGVSASIAARERDKAAAMWNDATSEMTMLLRESMAELVDHLVEKLTPDTDGSKKVFKASNMIENFTEFFANFEDRNIMQDEKLSALVADAKKLMEGVDADELKSSKRTRAQVVSGFGEIKAKLDAMLIDATDRAFSFDNV